ncbi:histidine kinase [Oscillibacter sp. MSJ-2]|uniref:histidine kinase n=1 Tax=Dysosmobacter acutus TaxID=2841504 RepID=A0ABS6FC89_9FIRM|nr:ATP-binding protein [Dysosmobacter acutus]MBU5627903.1 histidine kinase [Dysosmobacter acutus]
MTKRIFRSIVLSSVAVLLASTALIMGVLYEYFTARLETELATETGYIAQGVIAQGETYLRSLKPGNSRITWVDSDGSVLYDNREDASAMENHAGREEIRQAMESGTGTSSRYSDTLSQQAIYYAQRLSDNTVLRVSSQKYTVWVLLLQVLQPAMFILLAALILGLFLASRLSQKIIRPINALDLQHPEEGECYDELAPLLGRIRSQNEVIGRQMEELRRRQKEFTAITENMSEGFLIVDRNTNILSYNSAALRLLEAQAPDGVSILTLNRSWAVRSAVESALDGQRCEQRMEKDGRVEQLIANPVREGEQVAGAVLVILDVTEKEQRETLRREFTANVSHELKTPLTSILGTAEIIENGMVKSEDVGHFAGNIRKETQRLIDMVGDIIKLSRLDEGDSGAKWEEVELLALSRSVARQLSDAARRAQVSFQVEGEDAAVPGVGQIVEEMLYNLCDNAVAYNHPGGSVTVEVRKEAGGARVTVSDTGAGIPKDQQSRIFERFYRVDKSRSSKGTGLGLSIVKHGALYLGASVEVESEVGRGSTFTLHFKG